VDPIHFIEVVKITVKLGLYYLQKDDHRDLHNYRYMTHNLNPEVGNMHFVDSTALLELGYLL